MTDTATLRQLTARLGELEREITAIRRTLESLQQSEDTLTAISPDKTNLTNQMQQLLQRLAITGRPIGAERLQTQMIQANLTRNELSQSLIAARGD